MNYIIDILEDDILLKYPLVLEILLKDQTTKKNIKWATDNYEHLGPLYSKFNTIEIELITGYHSKVIVPRSKKHVSSQVSRTKSMAEVFTPSWICNLQNNSIDDAWFGRKNVFNKEKEGVKWVTNTKKIIFPKQKTWKSYIRQKRLEIACGEAPYITSRYDTVTGQFIKVEDRIGFLDRKLRIISENTSTSRDWLRGASIAYKSTYAYELQGDNLLLARQALLFTFIENYQLKFNKEPALRSIQSIAKIISWNVWQMDGLNGIVPYSCDMSRINFDLLQYDKLGECNCPRCIINSDHHGIYCIIKDWFKKDEVTGRYGKKLLFIDLVGN